MAVKRYVVHARRVGGWWALDVEGLVGAHTQVRRIDQAEDMAREAIAGLLEVAPGSFGVVVSPIVPGSVRSVVEEATRARSKAASAQEAAASAMRDAAKRLLGEGLTVRDAGVLLGVSHQRVAQLMKPVGWRSAPMGRRVELP